MGHKSISKKLGQLLERGKKTKQIGRKKIKTREKQT